MESFGRNGLDGVVPFNDLQELLILIHKIFSLGSLENEVYKQEQNDVESLRNQNIIKCNEIKTNKVCLINVVYWFQEFKNVLKWMEVILNNYNIKLK